MDNHIDFDTDAELSGSKNGTGQQAVETLPSTRGRLTLRREEHRSQLMWSFLEQLLQ